MPSNGNSASKKRNVTIKEVAKAAGVSVATVSYVLNNTGSVSTPVRNKVLNTAKNMGYRPNLSARSMRTGKTQTLGLILPDLCNPFFPELAQSIENSAREAGYSVVLIDTQGKRDVETEGIKRLIQNGVEGIVWCPTTNENPLKSIAGNTPIVVVDRPLSDFDFVSSDYTHGGKLLAEYLRQRNHRSIALVSGPLALPSARARRDGFIGELSDPTVIKWEMENEFSIQLSSPVKNALAQVSGPSGPSVIVCGNDLIAIGVMRELQSLGKKIPDDISVVGFDDIPWARIVTPELTTIRQPISQLGLEAVDLLLRRISNKSASKRQLTLEVHLKERHSVRDMTHE